MTFILDQLARSELLPASVSTSILSGPSPSVSDLIPHLVIGSLDAEALTAGDKSATWTQRRIARQLLVLTFMTALLLERTFGAQQGGAATTASQERQL